MKLKQLSIAILAGSLPITSVFAAALERSNQSIQAFLEPGNYIEAGFNVTDQNITGRTTENLVASYAANGSASATTTHNNSINRSQGNVGDTYLTPNVAAKIQASNKISLGLLYDQPFAINTDFKNSETSPYNKNTSGTIGATNFKIETKNLTLLMGYDLSSNFKVIVGASMQELEGQANLYGNMLRVNAALRAFTYYKESFKDKNAYGWLTGLAFQNDDKTFEANITYRSKIEHKFSADTTTYNAIIIPTTASGPKAQYDSLKSQAYKDNTFTTPQSINLTLNKIITDKTTLLFNTRWVDWSNAGLDLSGFKARSQLNGTESTTSSHIALYPYAENRPSKQGGYDLLAYNKDQWSIDLGVDQKLNDKWKVNGSLGWDSGVGAISHLTPDSGSWSAGIGVQYSPVENYFVQTGFKYYWLKDVKGQHSKQVSDNSNKSDINFENNYALSYDFKIGYRF